MRLRLVGPEVVVEQAANHTCFARFTLPNE